MKLTNSWLGKYNVYHFDTFSHEIPVPMAGILDGCDYAFYFHSDWLPIIVGALARLEEPSLYVGDIETKERVAQDVTNAIAKMTSGESPCLPESISETECAYYPSFYAGIEYIPYNPFGSEPPPNNYPTGAPFYKFGRIDTFLPNWIDDFFQGAVENVTGYLENDVFTSYLSLPANANPFDGLDYPTIKLTVRGTGKLTMYLLSVPFGGRALVSFDPPDIGDLFSAVFTQQDRILELNRDLFSAVPETDVDVIEEIILDEDKTHEIYVTFLPTINDEAPILQYGGGFRGYEVCGNLTVIDPVTGLPVNSDGDINFQEGVIVATVDDLYDALVRYRDTDTIRWQLARVLAQETPITINPDGSVEAVSSGGFSASPEEVAYGRALSVSEGINEYFEKLNGYAEDANISNSRAESFMVAQYSLNASITNAVTAMVNFEQQATAPNIFPVFFQEALYQGQISKQVLATTIIEADFSEVSLTDAWLASIEALTQEQLDSWADAGVPSTAVFGSPSYLPPAYDFTWTAQQLTDGRDRDFDLQPSYDFARKFRLEFSGQITNGDGHTWNGVYLQDSNGVYQYNPVRLAVNPSPAALNLVPDAQPPNRFGGATVLGYTDTNPSDATRNGAYRLIAVDFNAINVFRAVTPLTGTMSFRLITVE
ncbi:MAG: hypothetical protein AAFN66_05385 [Pseudomonadota bacterium]